MAVNFSDLPSTTTPINASNLNKIQSDLKSEVFEGTTRITDCDDATTPGIYQYIGTTANIPEKAGRYGNLVVLKTTVGGQTYLTQIAVGNYSQGNTVYYSMARRAYTNVWSEWDYFGEYDSGWLKPTLGSNFEVYSSNYDFKVRKLGEVIYVQGCVKPKAEIAINAAISQKTIYTLPENYRPAHALTFTIRGSGKNIAQAVVGANGIIYVEHYGTTAESVIPAGASLYLNFSFCLN